LWDLHLVDPDNRRPVDYETRRRLLATMRPCSGRAAPPDLIADLLEQRSDGRVKIYVMNRALAARAALRDAYETGDYTPLATAGARRDHAFAFARGGRAITCVPRLVASLMPDGQPPIGSAAWRDTRIELPEPLRGRAYRDVFTGAVLDADDTLALADVFERFPVAILVAADGAPPDRTDRP
jgi:(1->4)-alpha-D-glucan 1-alpha-D-glucosylmutase